MYRRDYVLRLIEAFGRALIALRDRILQRKADGPAVLAEIGEIAREAGLDLDVARRLDPASLLMWLSPAGEYDPARLWLLAELLYLAGLQADAEQPGAGRPDYERALSLLGHVPPAWTPPGEFGSAGEFAGEMRSRLQQP